MVDVNFIGDDDEWVIWNSAHGLVTTVSIGLIETEATCKVAWLDEPFDMVGPFDLSELESRGRISFAACLIMSRQKWQEDQVKLRQESLKNRRKAQQTMKEEFIRFSGRRFESDKLHNYSNERQYREVLNLPLEGKLERRQVNIAFRRLAQKAHPDVGGNNERFVRIKEARNALLETVI